MANNFDQLAQFGSALNGFSTFANQGFIPKHEILTVNSLQDAQSFQIRKGESFDLLDPNNDILYIKECDNLGKITLRAFHLAEFTPQEEVNTPDYATKQDLNIVINKIDALLNQMGGKHETKKSESRSGQPELDFTDK